jgi:hypothetical protein
VRLGVVGRHAEDDDAGPLELLPEVAEPAGLFRTARRIVLRIEIDDDVLALEVGEGDALAD